MTHLNSRLLYEAGLTKPAVDQLMNVQRATDTAQTTAVASAETSAKGIGTNFVWNTDPAGVYPSGDPTRDLVVVFYDSAGAQVATRTLRGTLTSASGLIAVTAVSTTGEATTYVLIDDGTASVRADITHTASTAKASLAWSSVDTSVAGGTPASGGSK